MSELTIYKKYNKLFVDSREVAKMIDRDHKHLLRDIRSYLTYLGKSNFGPADFFIESYYTDSQGKPRPHFLLTKKGCDMVANKLTGEKGVLFTASYVSKFEEMENKLKQQTLDSSQLSPELQIMDRMVKSLAQQELEQKRINNKLEETSEKVNSMATVFKLQPKNWRSGVNKIINSIAVQHGKSFKELRNYTYELLEQRAKCKLDIRLSNLKRNLAYEGASQTRVNKANKLDCIESDTRLTEIYLTIIKEMAVQYDVRLDHLEEVN